MKYYITLIFFLCVVSAHTQSQTGITQDSRIEILGDSASNQYVIRETTLLDNGYTKSEIKPESGTYTLEEVKEIAVQYATETQRRVAYAERQSITQSAKVQNIRAALSSRGVDLDRETTKKYYRQFEGRWVLFINTEENKFNLTAKGDPKGNLMFRYRNQLFPAQILSDQDFVIAFPEQLGGKVHFYLIEKRRNALVFSSKGLENQYVIVKR